MKLSKDQNRRFSGLEGEEWENHKFWFVSLMAAWKAAHGLNLSENPYLAKTISNIVYLNEAGKRIYEPNNAAPKTHPHRVIVQVEHIEIEHIQPRSASEKEAFVASNLQLSVKDAKDRKEFQLACLEKAKAAASLAMLAKSSGWENVEIDGDPYERLALAMACDGLGIKHNVDVNSLTFQTPTIFEGKDNVDNLIKGAIEGSLNIIINQRPNMSFGITPPQYELEKQAMNEEAFNDIFGNNDPTEDPLVADAQDEGNHADDEFLPEAFNLGSINGSSPRP